MASRKTGKISRFKKRRDLNIGLIIFLFVFIYLIIYICLYFSKDQVSIFRRIRLRRII